MFCAVYCAVLGCAVELSFTYCLVSRAGVLFIQNLVVNIPRTNLSVGVLKALLGERLGLGLPATEA